MYPFGPEWVKHPREGWPARAEQTALAERIKHLPRQLSKSIRRQPDLVQLSFDTAIRKPVVRVRHSDARMGAGLTTRFRWTGQHF